jgi:hypothetical protein
MWIQKNQPVPCDKVGRGDDGECIERDLISALIGNFAATLPGGLPYTPWAAELVKSRAAQAASNPHARCMPPNFPWAYNLPHIEKFVQNPGLLIILDEFNASYRQIFTDGRPLPVDPQPAWNGYSTGKWEGDNLVVNSIGFRDDLWLDSSGKPSPKPPS